MNGTGKLTFSGRLTMPEKDHCTRAVLSVFAYDSDGKIIASASAAVGESETAPGSAGKQFFLPINIRQWAIWLAAAALLIWACAAVRKKLAERKQ